MTIKRTMLFKLKSLSNATPVSVYQRSIEQKERNYRNTDSYQWKSLAFCVKLYCKK
jgi:hypothetical protein